VVNFFDVYCICNDVPEVLLPHLPRHGSLFCANQWAAGVDIRGGLLLAHVDAATGRLLRLPRHVLQDQVLWLLGKL
jgi:hypothetical protein